MTYEVIVLALMNILHLPIVNLLFACITILVQYLYDWSCDNVSHIEYVKE